MDKIPGAGVGGVPPPVEYQFKPGQSGNPAGKPKGCRSISTILREYMEKELDAVDPFEKKKTRKKVSELVAMMMIKKAISDQDLNAAKEILDRLEGKAPQKINFGDDEGNGNKIFLEIIHTNANEGDDSPGQEPQGSIEDHS